MKHVVFINILYMVYCTAIYLMCFILCARLQCNDSLRYTQSILRIRTMMATNSSEEAGGCIILNVDSHSNNPTKAWSIMKENGINRNHTKLQPKDPATAISQDKIRFVCISDTHALIEKRPNYTVPGGDVLLHTGDITNEGQPHEIKQFNEYLGKLVD